MNNHLILFLSASEAQIIKDALTAHANEADRTGDPLCESEMCDLLWERLDKLSELAHLEAKEALKAIGLGRYRGRPQG